MGSQSGGIWRQLFCLGASREEKKKHHGVTAVKAREASVLHAAAYRNMEVFLSGTRLLINEEL